MPLYFFSSLHMRHYLIYQAVLTLSMPPGCTLLFLGNTMQNTTRRYNKCVIRSKGLKDYIYNKCRVIHILVSYSIIPRYIVSSLVQTQIKIQHPCKSHRRSTWTIVIHFCWCTKVLYKVDSSNNISVTRKFLQRRKTY